MFHFKLFSFFRFAAKRIVIYSSRLQFVFTEALRCRCHNMIKVRNVSADIVFYLIVLACGTAWLRDHAAIAAVQLLQRLNTDWLIDWCICMKKVQRRIQIYYAALSHRSIIIDWLRDVINTHYASRYNPTVFEYLTVNLITALLTG